MAHRKVSTWFRSYRKKRMNIITNSTEIEGLSFILEAYKKGKVSKKIKFREVEKIRVVLEQMCNGLNPNWQAEQILECYLDRKNKWID